MLDFGPLKKPARRTALHLLAAVIFSVGLFYFPFGSMDRFIKLASAKYRNEGAKIVAVREGLTETIQYLRKDYLDRPLFYRLVTNRFSMSGTHTAARRYMKFYVYFPAAVHPHPEKALLISYGVGSTAKALTDMAGLETIDVVDISRDILDMSSVVFPDPKDNPLKDPRVRVHVEDGRFFLQTTPERFDIITSEPPPPKIAGVVNLYTQEYFQLIHDRLNDGGITTYWLPVYQLEERETRAILKAFANVFEDCSLWTGRGLDWMMVGVKNPRPPVSEAYFRSQWNQPRVAAEMAALGFERPEQIGATFMMDGNELRILTAATPPLTDNHPKRLGDRRVSSPEDFPLFYEYMNIKRARASFHGSSFIKKLWPDEMIAETMPYFTFQDDFNQVITQGLPSRLSFTRMHRLLTASDLRVPVMWALSSNQSIQNIVDQIDPNDPKHRPLVLYHLAVRALADRDYAEALRLFSEVRELKPDSGHLPLEVYLSCLIGKPDDARRLIQENRALFDEKKMKSFLEWLERTFGVDGLI